MTDVPRSPVILDIVEEHFEELDFLWEQRENVLFAPDWDLADLAELEERAEAHLDGLRVAGPSAIEVAREALSGNAPLAATLVLMDGGDPELAEEVVRAFAAADDFEVRDRIRIGLRHSQIDAIRDSLMTLAGDQDPTLSTCSADVLVFHRAAQVPEFGHMVGAETAEIRSLGYHTLGRQRDLRAPEMLTTALADESPSVRRAALQAAAASGLPGLDAICRAASASLDEPHLEALEFLGVVGNPADLPRLATGARQFGVATAAIRAIGAMGRIQSIPLLIELMGSEDPESAALAASAFTRITGEDDIELEPVNPPQMLDEEDEADEDETPEEAPVDLEVEFSEAPDVPDAARADAWWRENANRFHSERRWQAGQDVTDVMLAMPIAKLETRRDLYLGLCSQSGPGAPIIELEARARPAT